MATVSTRRAAATSSRRTKDDVDDLAQRLASNLKVTAVAGTRAGATRRTARTALAPAKAKDSSTAKPQSDDDRRKAMMKNVNSALQTLANAVQAEWSASVVSRKRSDYTVSQLSSLAKSTRCTLSLLRTLMPESLDVERAAMSLVGKLLSVELFDSAVELLSDSRAHLATLYQSDVDLQATVPSSITALLHLPIPSTISPPDASLQTIILSYFSNALLVVARITSLQSSIRDSFVDSLAEPGCFASWIPHLTACPTTSVDSVLKRNYVALTTYFNFPPSLSQTVLKIRFFGLRSLLLSSDLEPNAFWDQCMKFSASYIKSSSDTDSLETFNCVLECFANVVRCAEQRSDTEPVMVGKSWISFCEYWMAIAKKVNDYSLIDHVATYIQKCASTSRTTLSHPLPTIHSTNTSAEDFAQKASQICAVLAQSTACLDRICSNEGHGGDGLETRLDASHALMTDFRQMLSHGLTNVAESASKMRRALERLRRSCVKSLDCRSLDATGKDAVRSLLEHIVEKLFSIIEDGPQEGSDFAVSALDSLFNLATSVLNVQRADTCDKAYAYLERAEKVVNSYSNAASSGSETLEWKRNTANYIRCTSGAFFNVAGSLYKAEKYGLAIRFLKRACPLAESASAAHEALAPASDGKGKTSDRAGSSAEDKKDEEAWAVHRAQVYKRWELLGVCYGKLPDRKLAHHAFVKALANYSFDEDLRRKAVENPTIDIFSLTEYKNVGTMIDRVTYMGAAELFLGKDTSLRMSLRDLPSPLLAAVLERQIVSLAESRWKPAISSVVDELLIEILDVLGDTLPLRRAKALLARLEHIYFSGCPVKRSLVDEISARIQRILEAESNVDDAKQKSASLHYLVLTHLWLALIAHSDDSLDNKGEFVLRHANEAHSLLDQMQSKLFETAKEVAQANGIVRGTKRESKSVANVKSSRGTVGRGNKAAQSGSGNKRNASSLQQTPPKPLSPECGQNRGGRPAEFSSLLPILRMVIELLGLLGHTYARMQLLVLEQRLAEALGDCNEAYLAASNDFAYELFKLGKVEQAIAVYSTSLDRLRGAKRCSSQSILLQLRYAEALAVTGNVSRSIALYEEAFQSCEDLVCDERGASMLSRTQERVDRIERSAMASVAFAAIQLAKDNPIAALDSFLQSLRLLNRAVDCLSKLTTPKEPIQSDLVDPFDTSDLREALPNVNSTQNLSPKTEYRRTMLGGAEWRIAISLFDTMFSLSTVYFMRGSSREAEYFTKQAEDLARCLGSPAILCRALSRQSEVLLFRGRLDDAKVTLLEAYDLSPLANGIDAADAARLRGDLFHRLTQASDAQEMYANAAKTLDDLGSTFVAFDYQIQSRRRSSIASPKLPYAIKTFVAPSILALTLKQHIWLLRDKADDTFEGLLTKFLSLPQSLDVQAEANFLLGRLALHDIHARFLQDMKLNSLAESTVALPMGMICNGSPVRAPQDVLEALSSAENLYVSGLSAFYEKGSVMHLRNSAVSLALVKAFQTSLGVAGSQGPATAARLLDMASSITLRKELIESIQYKLRDMLNQDDLRWPSFLPQPTQKRQRLPTLNMFENTLDSDDEDQSEEGKGLRNYWERLMRKHQSEVIKQDTMRGNAADKLPDNWVVVTVNMTDDKETLLISRQRAGKEPFIFCIPFRGRRENDDNEHFTYDDAITELNDIIKCSDEGTRQAANIGRDDKEGKSAWWAERKKLDERLKDLLENIEFCWLGAFKTIFGPPMRIPSDVIPTFRARIEKVFKEMLRPHEKKLKRAKFKLEDSLLELLATLPTNCRDEEIEDVIYFVLDLYHFHGVQISSADIDLDVTGIDLRSAFEDHQKKTRGRVVAERDAHLFLVLDKNVQGIPWESMPMLRGKSVSRIPGISFLIDRLDFVRQQTGSDDATIDRACVDPSKAFYVLNPGGDLSATEDRFKDWIDKMKKVGWTGTAGHKPSEQQLVNALSGKDLVVYFGHGGGEQYIRSHKIRHLQRCAATMLWGCSSGAMREMGDFDRIGTPNNYMLAGCPTLVANLWDVTDRDIDKFALSVFDKLRLEPSEVKKWQSGRKSAVECKTSVVAAVAQSRDVCKLKYLTGAAVVVYGIPFYL